MTLRFGVLGAVTAWRNGTSADVGHALQQRVLAALLVDAGQAVPAEILMDRVWGVEAPRRGRETLYGYISRLRRVLSRLSAVTIERSSAGYRLPVDLHQVDMHQFRHLVGRAREQGDVGQAAALWEKALGLWRGEAFTEIDTPWFAGQRSFLDRERLAAQLDLADARLRLGEHDRILAELVLRADAQPSDERVAGQLMLALYRSGRSADALAHYRTVRGRLVEELGTEPGPALQRLHQRMLTNDPLLDPRETTRIASPDKPVPAAVPRQLPAPPALFVGRENESAALDALLDHTSERESAQRVATIVGVGGIGKTWLALHWAHRHLGNFPDGQLYVNLRGFDPSADPLPAAVAVRGFLHAMGVAAQAVPARSEAQAALYRSLTADRRMLIVLDNARDAEHVAPLLPGGPACAVVVTSRNRLPGLITAHGARPVPLNVLSDADARDLFVRHLGGLYARGERDAVTDVLRHCAGLPLALAITAARASSQPAFPLAVLADELCQESGRLDALDAGDITSSLRAVFSASCKALTPAAADSFFLLGLVPGPDISVEAAAHLFGCRRPRARALLRELETAHLIQQHVPHRYQLHDLLRRYAAEQGQDGSPPRPQAGVRRVHDFYLRAARTAAEAMQPETLRLPPPQQEVSAADVSAFADSATAMRWLDAECANLVATVISTAVTGPRLTAWLLADVLTGYFSARMNAADWQSTAEAGLRAAETGGDCQAQAAVEFSLGRLYTRQARYEQAGRHHARALAHAIDGGWSDGQALAQNYLAATHWRTGRLTTAFDLLSRSLRINQTTEWGRRFGQAHTLLLLGCVLSEQGMLRAATDHALESLARYRQAGSPAGTGMALGNLGEYHLLQGNLDEAFDQITRARAIEERIDQRPTPDTLRLLAGVHRDAGRLGQALSIAKKAVGIADAQGDLRSQADTLNMLASVHHHRGDPGRALVHYRRALRLAQQTSPYVETEIHIGLATVLTVLARHRQARHHLTTALELTRHSGYRMLEGQALTALAADHLARDEREPAARHAFHALHIHQETGHRPGDRHTRQLLTRAVASAPPAM
ncbi:AfsR/SARP family transcriptional regulator [Streptomyces sp. PBH53]|uniref:AfsR/SARP family transcriptional regulator n=1 Tax=Streptomyces sp. PBH53 TaxID=1577075 RepID=UPI000A4EFCF8|nr:BTAD domain-containing putative transcriptional regulator [Streptomyces sp. PBH53]